MKIFDWHREKRWTHCTAVIVAAGSATRMRGVDKIMAELNGEPVIVHTIRSFQRAACIDEIVLVAREDRLEPMQKLVEEWKFSKVRAIVPGGENRMESVQAGLNAASPETVLAAVQDGARPLVTEEIICRTVDMALSYHAAAPAIPVKDTIKVVNEENRVESTPDRATLRAVQTPQVFDKELLQAAWQRAKKEKLPYTDDCSAMEGLGVHVYLTEGSEENLKITTPLDLKIAELILEGRNAACESDTAMTSTSSLKEES